ncbi:WhiB family transcriptional regulator [Streptomyces sp. NPDC004856]|uniref:WhiB family transcriptional regulator n=2 Tax=unclassified Streptomyces TaxID=2593676 RepID=UPI0033BB46B7
MEWLDRAACVDEDPELFFPVGTTGPSVQDEQAAKEVCDRCPVITECLGWAVATGQTTGVWGGTSETERASLLRARRRQERRRTRVEAEAG